MEDNMRTFKLEWDSDDIAGAVLLGFDYMERRDEIVGSMYACPAVLKEIVLALPNEVEFAYIPEGFGMFRTAYLKFKPSVKENEIRFVNQEKTTELRLFLQ